MDDGLKQRLVGAIVLVAIAVLFLPSLFDRDSRRTVDLGSEIPPEPAVTTRMLEVGEPEPPENIPSAKPLADNYPHEEARSASVDSDGPATRDSRQVAEAEESEAEAPSAAPSEPSSDSSSEPSPEPLSESPSGTDETATTAPELNADGVPNAWSLQVGSFESGERALSLLKRLQEAGYKSYIREGISTQGAVYRVFAGPKINKAAAQADKQDIDKRFNTSALLVEFKP